MSHQKLNLLPPYQKQQRKSYAGFSSATLQPALATSNFSNTFQLLVTAPTSAVSNFSAMGANEKVPAGFTIMEHQVAGHTFQVGSDEIGLLRSVDDGSVLKPGGKPMCCAREIKFYEQLMTTTDKEILPLRDFTTEFRGSQTLNVGSKTVNFIKLRDLTYGMLEPCVMDIKMGRRTWDPLTTEQKRKNEESKYADCKNTVSFCIPGFQTFHIASGSYKKFGKEYGKKLNENTVKDALKIFLNAEAGLCRPLIMQILTNLWSIQKFMRTQKVFQFYSSSILIVYDARKLRQVLELQKRQTTVEGNNTNNNNNSTLLSPTPSQSDSALEFKFNAARNGNSPPADSFADKEPPKTIYRKIQRAHSSMNNYEQEMRKMKDNYAIMLDSLVGTYDSSKDWVFVKMIDFAHTFNNSEMTSDGQAPTLDRNYLDGIEHLVEIFEEFLKMCD